MSEVEVPAVAKKIKTFFKKLAIFLKKLAVFFGTTVVLRPLMVVAGDHANNDMAGADEDSWKTMFEAAGLTVNCQISGLGRIADVQALYVAHTKAAIDAIA